MHSGITSGRVQKGMSTHAMCPVEWGEISTNSLEANANKLTSRIFV